MALRSNRDELVAAWRALAGHRGADGWRTIPVGPRGAHRLLAGRRFPGNEEALLVGFTAVRVPATDRLPQGRGFLVCKADLGNPGAGRVWIALCRQDAGNMDLFAMMADDVMATLEGLPLVDDERLFQVFLTRIRAWQDFMQQGTDGILSPEAEIGLFGEIEVLRRLISGGLPPTVAVDGWQGPLDGIQDFMLGTGAIEVKTTVSPSTFPVTIDSLEQLDDTLTRPLFLVGIRLALDVSGRTLPEQIRELRDALQQERGSLAAFDSRLLHAGFLDAFAERYRRHFSCAGERMLHVSEGFPRLTRANAAKEIRRARYEIDINLVSAGDVGLAHMLTQLGVLQEWN